MLPLESLQGFQTDIATACSYVARRPSSFCYGQTKEEVYEGCRRWKGALPGLLRGGSRSCYVIPTRLILHVPMRPSSCRGIYQENSDRPVLSP
ncbi:hypothetical protein IG631_22117 [Alternaria alternata]|nr:hypothetical protein IG631_22117 [Alternaria alternata]